MYKRQDEKIKGNEEQAISKMIININQKNQEVFEFPLGDNDTVIMACNSLEFNDWYLLSFKMCIRDRVCILETVLP